MSVCGVPRVTPSDAAVIVFCSAVLELIENVTTPSAPVVPGLPVMVLSLPEASTVTVRPPSTVPVASRTVTVMVLAEPAGTVAGSI